MATIKIRWQQLEIICAILCCIIALYFIGQTYYPLLMKGLNLDESTTIAVLDRESLLKSIFRTVKNIHSGWIYPLFIYPLLDLYFVAHNELILRISSLLFTVVFAYRAALFARNFGLTKGESYYLGLLLLSLPGVVHTAAVIRPYAIASLLAIIFLDAQWRLLVRKSYNVYILFPLGFILIFLFHPLYAASFALCSLGLMVCTSQINLRTLLKERLGLVLCVGVSFLVAAIPLLLALFKRIVLVNSSAVVTTALPDLFVVWKVGMYLCLILFFVLLYWLCKNFIGGLQKVEKPKEALSEAESFKIASICWISVPTIFWLVHAYLDIPINYIRYMNLPSVFMLMTLILATRLIQFQSARHLLLLLTLLFSSADTFLMSRIFTIEDTRYIKQYIDQMNDSSIPILISSGHIESVLEAYILEDEHQAINLAPLKAYSVPNAAIALPPWPDDLMSMPRYFTVVQDFIANAQASNFIVIVSKPHKWVSTLDKELGLSCNIKADWIRFGAMTCTKSAV